MSEQCTWYMILLGSSIDPGRWTPVEAMRNFILFTETEEAAVEWAKNNIHKYNSTAIYRIAKVVKEITMTTSIKVKEIE